MYNSDIEKILVSNAEIAKRADEIAAQINADYKGKPILVVGILRGASIFLADIFKRLEGDVELDFMSLSSYGNGTNSSGEVKMIKDLSEPVDGKNILIIEDIIDTGITLSYLIKVLEARNPESIKLCALLDKPSRRKVELKGDYIGFEIPDEYVVGYGLDYAEKYRNLPDVCVLSKKVYEK
ncbi:hypoxanthine phosphoribosyltransferase [Acidaminococcus sp. CAG:917]|nr:hypoxanthine phosphoribosyltransferase [Acidaminococcus sp. CAG:917]